MTAWRATGALLAWLVLGCSPPAHREGLAALEARFPGQVARVLPGERAAEPPRVSDDGVMSIALPDGWTLEVREHGVTGPPLRHQGAQVIARNGGTSFWRSTAAGVEEWILLEPGAMPLRWTVNAELQLLADGEVAVRDQRGAQRFRVRAPVAYADGFALRPLLRVEGRELILEVDAPPGAAVLIDPEWIPTGGLFTVHNGHTATTLQDGRVLIAGGDNPPYTRCEIYDPRSGQVTNSTPMNFGRFDHTAELLLDGRVMVAGGDNGSGARNAVELFDPLGETWTVVNSMASARSEHFMTRLPTGEVLVANGIMDQSSGPRLNTAELFRPDSGTWLTVGPTGTAHHRGAMTLLPDGGVIITGGTTNGTVALATTEHYNAATRTFVAGPLMLAARVGHAASVLRGGELLVSGGTNYSSTLPRAERLNPAALGFVDAGPMVTPRDSPDVALLPDGKLLIAGGFSPLGVETPSAELFNPDAGTFSAAPSMPQARNTAVAVPLFTGQVLFSGGRTSSSTTLSSNLLYDLSSPQWTAGAALTVRRDGASFDLLNNQRVLRAGGQAPAGPALADAQLYDPLTNSWSPAASLGSARAHHGSMMLNDGRLLVVGGHNGTTPLASCELYDAASNSWTATGAMATALIPGPLVLLHDGRVGRFGGAELSDGTNPTAAVEIWSPATGAWSVAAPMPSPRWGHSATFTSDSVVQVVGGRTAGGFLDTTSRYNAGTNSWINGPTLSVARAFHAAVVRLDQSLWIIGGESASGPDPAVDSLNLGASVWISRPPLPSGRARHAALVLFSGKILVSEGDNGAAPRAAPALFDGIAWDVLPLPQVERASHPLLLVRDGRALAIGGASSEDPRLMDLFSEGPAWPWRPGLVNLSAAGADTAWNGSGFTGGITDGRNGSAWSGTASVPVMVGRRIQGGITYTFQGRGFNATTAFTRVPPNMPSGHYFVRAVVQGVPSPEINIMLRNVGTSASCLSGGDCLSGFCVSGFCCDRACDGACETCAVLEGASINGTCGLRTAGFVCRAENDVCDVAESCTGAAPSCPADGFAPSTQVCRPLAGPCDLADSCSGAAPSCPADGFAPSTQVCRDAAGACDVPERCDGAAPSCPLNALLPPGVECRASSGACDAPEACDGASVSCPVDLPRPDATPCPNGLFCDGDERCLAGACAAANARTCTGGYCEEAGAQCVELPALAPLAPAEIECEVPFELQAALAAPVDGVSWSLSGPPGAEIDAASGRVGWTPPRSQFGDHALTVTARRGESTRQETLVVRVSCSSGRYVLGCASTASAGWSTLLLAGWAGVLWRRRRNA
jgi:hypothetical protein